jgi:hypothetical protein
MIRESPTGWRRWLWPLRSRKVQVAAATVVVAYAAQAGLVLSEETTLAVLSVGVALILGIAHEDAGRAPDRRDAHQGQADGSG